MGFVNDYEVIVAPVYSVYRQADDCVTTVAGKVGMKQNVIAQPVLCQRVVDEVSSVGHPVVLQLFGAQDEDVFVPAFVVFDYGQCGEGLTKTDAVREDAAVVLLQLVYDAQRRVPLEVVQLIPYHAALEAGRFVWQYVFGNVLQKFAENVVQCEEIYQLWRVLLVYGGYGINDVFGDVLHPAFIAPYTFKELHVFAAERGVEFVDHVIHVAASVAADVHGRKAIDGHIGNGLAVTIHVHEALHAFLRAVGFEGGLLADPFRTLTGNGFLGQLVPQLYLKLGAI